MQTEKCSALLYAHVWTDTGREPINRFPDLEAGSIWSNVPFRKIHDTFLRDIESLTLFGEDSIRQCFSISAVILAVDRGLAGALRIGQAE